MILKGEAFSKQLETFSDETAQLLSEVMGSTRLNLDKAMQIVSNSELTEEQVVEQLKELKRQYLKMRRAR